MLSSSAEYCSEVVVILEVNQTTKMRYCAEMYKLFFTECAMN